MKISTKDFLRRRVDFVTLPGKILTRAILAITLLSCSINAQPSDFPPPIKTLSESDRKFLEGAPNNSERLKRTASLMNSRLSAAEAAVATGDDTRMFFELGIFHGLIEQTLLKLLEYDGVKRTSSQLSNLRRFEIMLRGFPPRIELIRRRTFDLEIDSYITSLQSEIRDARSRALEPMFIKP